ncbi:MAG: carbohydrate kinase [Anaerolineae bacterium]|nr:carbohydrate kinase [Anaerolineae bacterium]
MASEFLLGIDAGTSLIKAAVFTLVGEEVGSAERETPVISPYIGWAESDMGAVWQAARAVIPEALANAGVSGDAVAALGVTGQMVGAWLIDGDGQPVRRAILWCDGRAQGLIDRLSAEQPGFLSTIFDSSGSAMQQGCTLPVLRWLLEHEPETLARARHVLCCKDWLVYNLTGTIQLDPAEVSVMPGSTRDRDLSEAMIDLFGLRGLRSLFPDTRPAENIAGGLLPGVAQALGMRAGIPVAVGTGDVLATVIGAGVVTPGTAVSLLGTNYLNCLVTAEPIFEPRDVGVMFCPPAGGWLRAMLNVSGTTSLDWLIEQFFAAEWAEAGSNAALFAKLEQMAKASGLGARGVLYLPYLSAQGITAPVYEPNARAEFYGLSLEHTRADMLRAVYEGLALSIRDGYACIPAQINEIRLTGGTARSDFFCQLVADATGKRVTRPQASQFGARGAALLAAVGIGVYASISDAVERTPLPAQTFAPNPANAAQYDVVYARYVKLRTALMNVWRA